MERYREVTDGLPEWMLDLLSLVYVDLCDSLRAKAIGPKCLCSQPCYTYAAWTAASVCVPSTARKQQAPSFSFYHTILHKSLKSSYITFHCAFMHTVMPHVCHTKTTMFWM